ncbi:MAG TPA: DedA family protein [Allosphingosinicella sp.]|jgi:membrane protein DedA with SNARE-associated domain
MTDWVIRLVEHSGYFGIAMLMFLETIFPPVPSEVIMPLAGVSAAEGRMTLAGVIASGSLGAMAGNIFWYLVAWRLGLRRFRPFIEKRGRWLTLDWYDVEKVERLFGRFGPVIVAIGRMMPTIRSVISIPAGLVHMRLPKFLFWSTVGTVGWSALLAVAGFMLKQQFSEVEQVLGPVSTLIIAGIVIAYVWRQLTWHRRHRQP